MTRINCVEPKCLTREHLIAEYRELPRVFGLVRKAIERGETPQSIASRSPSEYTLGKGHVLFFYTRLGWLEMRHSELVAEMRRRDYRVNYPDPATIGIGSEWFGDWTVTEDARQINLARIRERLGSRSVDVVVA